MLWQTDTINPAHEHFITSLIKQKIQVNIEKLQAIAPTQHDNRFVLFLPENEIHELGLTYANYEIIRSGYPSIYLGQSVPINCLKPFTAYNDKITFITYFTVEPAIDKIEEYINDIQDNILSKCNSELLILGRKVYEMENFVLPKNIQLIKMTEMIEVVQNKTQQIV